MMAMTLPTTATSSDHTPMYHDLRSWMKHHLTAAPPPTQPIDMNFSLSLTDMEASSKEKKNLAILQEAARNNYYPKMNIDLPSDFTQLIVVDKNTNLKIPIWKYVLSVCDVCGILKE